jgi:hypothetical protein
MKARKGDLVLIERTERSYVIGQPSTESTTYEFGVVHSATRDGIVKTWSSLAYGDELIHDYGRPLTHRERAYVMPKSDIDVTAVLEAAKAHHWPGHPGQPMPFDSIEEAKETARPFRVQRAA